MKIYYPNIGFGNYQTLRAFLAKLECELVIESVSVLSNAEDICIIVPGNGNWDSYRNDGLVELLKDTERCRYIVICGGFQALFHSSDEAFGSGAKRLSGHVERLNGRLPQLGMRSVSNVGKMYFANSYGIAEKHLENENKFNYVISDKSYVAALKFENIIGFQFHPEVSGLIGKNFFNKLLVNRSV